MTKPLRSCLPACSPIPALSLGLRESTLSFASPECLAGQFLWACGALWRRHNIPIDTAVEMLRGLYDGDDTVHSFTEPVNTARWFAVCYERWGLFPKLEWERADETPTRNWLGLPMRGFQVVDEACVRNALISSGLHPDSPYWPSRFWAKDYSKADMRMTVSTSRGWKAYHEAMRAALDTFCLNEQRFSMAKRHLRMLAVSGVSYGPAARASMKAREPW